MREYTTLIEFFFKRKVENFDQYAEGIEQLLYLSNLKLIDIDING